MSTVYIKEESLREALTARPNRQLELGKKCCGAEQGERIPTKTPFLRTVIGSVYPQHDVRERQMVRKDER